MFIDVVYFIILFTIALYGIYNYKRSVIAFRLLTILLSLTFFAEVLAYILASAMHENVTVYKIYTPLHIVLFTLIYYSLMSSLSTKALTLTIGFIVFLFITVLIINSDGQNFPNSIVSIDTGAIVLFSLIFFYEMIRTLSEDKLFISGLFWLNSSTLFYFSTKFAYWISFSYLFKHSPTILNTLIRIFGLLDPLYYLLLGMSLYFHIQNNKREILINLGKQ
ncbi:hypothetical protein [Ferruginibacter albus]|uniref:hypothetical protein n=1 Tax=Ferruginibacter albus TaxID=2875540 RepID=UPI001CC7C66F|nr:hypothetical protein [Ferruginibacter albus]UAY52635.1 hypothetical protein K9M53_02830 [Ferruginibacter albus]